MKIVIDARMLFWTGIGRYTKALLTNLEQIDQANTYLVLTRKADWGLWEPQSPNFQKVECNFNPYSFGEQWGLWLQLRGIKADLVHFTAPNAPVMYSGRRITTIHDLTLLDFDTSRGTGLMRSLRRLKRIPFRRVLKTGVRRSAGIITGTNYVRDQLIKRLGADPQRLTTVYLAADPQIAAAAPLERFGQLGQFVLYTGNLYPYKNVASTIRALAQLTDHPELSLVVAGRPDSYQAGLVQLADELGVTARVKFVGYVSDGELVSLYRAASAYINPSLSEGFGLQGLEAMAQGTPVIAARASCLPEVYADAAAYFDPHDPADQAAAIRRVLDEAGRAGGLQTAGYVRHQQFSWQRTAQQTLVAYQAALNRK